jgi:hypothetical protein
MSALIIRFVVGGIIVSLFAALGDVLGPKSFAGLFGAAPSIALATVALTIRQKGKAYAAIEARSMIFGACAFLIYAALVSWLLRRYKPPTLVATMTLLPVWFAVSLGLWFLIGERL